MVDMCPFKNHINSEIYIRSIFDEIDDQGMLTVQDSI